MSPCRQLVSLNECCKDTGIGYWRAESTFQERDRLDTIFLVQNASRCQRIKTSMQADGAFYSVGFERIHHQNPVHHIWFAWWMKTLVHMIRESKQGTCQMNNTKQESCLYLTHGRRSLGKYMWFLFAVVNIKIQMGINCLAGKLCTDVRYWYQPCKAKRSKGD